jgi:glycerophosphoryl diester phosphodiesterase
VSSLPLIIGHRGASRVAPENTLVAFEQALSDGADGVEFDVRLARDRVPIVIHDATLQRTGLKNIDVAALTSDELKKFDVGTWFNLRHPSKARPEYKNARVPTLAEAFNSMRNKAAVLYVEMKCEAKNDCSLMAREVSQLISDYSLTDRVVVESFSLDSITEIKRLNRQIPTAALFERKLSRPAPSISSMIAHAIACAADEIALHNSFPLRRAASEAAKHQLKIVVWTVDAPVWVTRGARYGLHALITNDPARLCAERKRLRATHAPQDFISSEQSL